MVCPHYTILRKKIYIKAYYYERPSTYKFIQLMKSDNKREQFRLMVQWRIQGGRGPALLPLKCLRCRKLELFSKIYKNMSDDGKFSKFLLNIF